MKKLIPKCLPGSKLENLASNVKKTTLSAVQSIPGFFDWMTNGSSVSDKLGYMSSEIAKKVGADETGQSVSEFVGSSVPYFVPYFNIYAAFDDARAAYKRTKDNTKNSVGDYANLATAAAFALKRKIKFKDTLKLLGINAGAQLIDPSDENYLKSLVDPTIYNSIENTVKRKKSK